MLTGFEEITYDLSDYEKNELLPILVRGFQKKIGPDRAVTNSIICARLKEKGCKINPARIRKLVNYIRTHGIVPGLIATSKGYYISDDPLEVGKYIASLRGRENEIQHVRKTFEVYLENLMNGTKQN